MGKPVFSLAAAISILSPQAWILPFNQGLSVPTLLHCRAAAYVCSTPLEPLAAALQWLHYSSTVLQHVLHYREWHPNPVRIIAQSAASHPQHASLGWLEALKPSQR